MGGRSNALGQLVADAPNARMVSAEWSHGEQINILGYTFFVQFFAGGKGCEHGRGMSKGGVSGMFVAQCLVR